MSVLGYRVGFDFGLFSENKRSLFLPKTGLVLLK